VRFEWDEAKNEAKKKIERVDGGEERWRAIGYVAGSLLFLPWFTPGSRTR
jgi:uncharacterized DUF497 family protein